MAIVATSLGTSTSATLGTTQNLTVTASVSVGDHVVIGGSGFSNAAYTITDSAGNTYTTHVTSNGRAFIASAKVTSALTSGVSTITMTGSPGQTAKNFIAAKVTGLDTTSWFDVSATGTAGGTTAAWSTNTTATTSTANEIVFAVCGCDTAGATTSTPVAGYTEIGDVTNGGAYQTVLQYKIVSSTGTQNSSGTWGSSGWTWNSCIATFKAAAAGGTDNINLTGIATAEAFSSLKLTDTANLSSIVTAENVPSLKLTDTMNLSGITSAENVPSVTLSGTDNINLSGIATAEAFSALNLKDTVNLAGLTTAEAFSAIKLTDQINLGGIASAENVPSIFQSAIGLQGIPSAENVPGVSLSEPGVANPERGLTQKGVGQ